MYAAQPAPESLRHGFSTLASWKSDGQGWTGVLSADPGFEIVWTLAGDRIARAPLLTPATLQPRQVSASGEAVHLRILRLRPAAVGPWIGPEARTLANRGPVPLRELGRRWREVAEAETDAELLGAVARIEIPEADALVRASVARLRSEPALDFARLADEMGYSYEQWYRRFKAATGVSPKFHHRYFRLQSATRLARRKPSMSMAEIAFRNGYGSDCRLAAESVAIAGQTFRELVQGFTLPE